MLTDHCTARDCRVVHMSVVVVDHKTLVKHVKEVEGSVVLEIAQITNIRQTTSYFDTFARWVLLI